MIAMFALMITYFRSSFKSTVDLQIYLLFLSVILFLPNIVYCQQATLKFTVIEESPIGTNVGNLRVALTNSGHWPISQINEAKFQFLDDNSYFIIDNSSNIKLKSVIDRESLCKTEDTCCPGQECTLKNLIMDTKTQNMIDLIFTINDINDNTPSWKTPFIEVSIPEHTKVNNRIRLPTAQDPDKGPENTTELYTISPQSERVFSLYQETQMSKEGVKQFKLWLQVNEELDREIRDKYQIKVLAIDGGKPARTGSVTINITVSDINDQPPVFKHQTSKVSIQENTVVGEIFRATAIDPDPSDASRLRYSLGLSATDAVKQKFRVDSRTGSVSLIKVLDYEDVYTSYTVPISVTDGTFITESTLTVIVINDNDNYPVITIRSHLTRDGSPKLWIRENLEPNQLLATIMVSDADDRDHQETIRCITDNTAFEILPLGKGGKNRLKLITKVKFDRELKSEYYVSITCTDGGNPPKSSKKPLTIKIDDDNDSPPQFMQSIYRVRVRENSPINTTIAQVTATDRDSGDNQEIKYTLDNFSSSDFSIDPRTGIIMTRSIFDREMRSQFNISVTATDRGFVPNNADPVHSTTTTVIVDIEDVNDCVPQFESSSYEFSVKEGSRVHASVGKVVATDSDVDPINHKVHYSLASDSNDDPVTKDYFGVNKIGEIYVRSNKIDREKTPVVTFQVVAIDNGIPPRSSSVNVLIRIEDVNDHTPVFNFPREGNRLVNMSYDTTMGHKIVEIVAIDLDQGPNSKLFYSIISGNEQKFFQLDPSSGVLYLATAMKKEHIRVYKLFLKVTDQGDSPRMATAVLDINVVGGSLYPYQSGQSMEKDLVIMISMIGVTLVISLVLIAAIVFLRCVRCSPFFKQRPAYPMVDRICFPDGRSSPALSELPHFCKQGGLPSPMMTRIGPHGTHIDPRMMDPMQSPRGGQLYYSMERSKMAMLGDTDSVTSGESYHDNPHLTMQAIHPHHAARMSQVHYYKQDCSVTLPKNIDSKRLLTFSTSSRDPDIDPRPAPLSVSWRDTYHTLGAQPVHRPGTTDSGTGLSGISEVKSEGEGSTASSVDQMGEGRAYTPLKQHRIASPKHYMNQPASFV